MTGDSLDRLHELFTAALRLDSPGRCAFLDRECDGDVALRRAVEQLLAIDAGSGEPTPASTLTGIANGAAWLAADLAEDESSLTEPVPNRIDRFEIIREIGRGGMGIVYEARQENPSRRVALKVIHPGLISRSLLRRFRQETRAMGQLLHPGIAQIYEAGTTKDDPAEPPQPYFVMELVNGPTIRRFAEDVHLSVEAKLEMIARVCDAIHHAHQKGVIHRDLKPDNILVDTPTVNAVDNTNADILPLGVQPKVLDFGVARLGEEHGAQTLGTQTGQIVGTIPYLSPEQAEGNSAVADIRSDGTRSG